jgi:predicted short-subunit dehydrogenase-like oxidoreductase (DUF2520 family)
MRELERDDLPSPLSASASREGAPRQSRGATRFELLVVGRGRVGRSLARAAQLAGIEVQTAGHHQVGDASADAGAVLLCVPDASIAQVASEIPAGPSFVGHVSGAGTLNLLAGAAATGARAFSLHPLQTFADGETVVDGIPAAIAGADADALAFARALAEALGMRPFEIAEGDRSAYHAAAAIASNLLVALEESAADLLTRLGADDARELLTPLVLRTAANWAERGPDALTGPIARGDQTTVDGHRAALRERAPELLPLYDALAARAKTLAGESSEVPA